MLFRSVYTGINKHEGEGVGLYDTVLSRQDYEATFINQPAETYEIERGEGIFKP